MDTKQKPEHPFHIPPTEDPRNSNTVLPRYFPNQSNYMKLSPEQCKLKYFLLKVTPILVTKITIYLLRYQFGYIDLICFLIYLLLFAYILLLIKKITWCVWITNVHNSLWTVIKTCQVIFFSNRFFSFLLQNHYLVPHKREINSVLCFSLQAF